MVGLKISSIVKLHQKVASFRGITLLPFVLNLNQFHGFGFTLLSIEWNWKGRICTMSNSLCLLYLGIHHGNDLSWIFTVNVLGKRWGKYLKPRVFGVCPVCRTRLHSGLAHIDGTIQEHGVYCDECDQFVEKENIIIKKEYKDE